MSDAMENKPNAEEFLWLCISRLPSHYTEEQFRTLLQLYGDPIRYHLIKKSGKCKGYGFVDYSGFEQRKLQFCFRAKIGLSEIEIDGKQLLVDWSYSLTVDVASDNIRSKCLYVEFNPVGELSLARKLFRRLFSSNCTPTYCQVFFGYDGLPNWGLVEYNSADEAEAMWEDHDGRIVEGPTVFHVSICAPDSSAIKTSLAIKTYHSIKKIHDKKKNTKTTQGLLPTPTIAQIVDNYNTMKNANACFECGIMPPLPSDQLSTSSLLPDQYPIMPPPPLPSDPLSTTSPLLPDQYPIMPPLPLGPPLNVVNYESCTSENLLPLTSNVTHHSSCTSLARPVSLHGTTHPSTNPTHNLPFPWTNAPPPVSLNPLTNPIHSYPPYPRTARPPPNAPPPVSTNPLTNPTHSYSPYPRTARRLPDSARPSAVPTHNYSPYPRAARPPLDSTRRLAVPTHNYSPYPRAARPPPDIIGTLLNLIAYKYLNG